MAELKSLYASYYEPVNTNKHTNNFDWGKARYSEDAHDMYQEAHDFTGSGYLAGMENVFHDEPVGKLFFSSKNVVRLQKQIKDSIYEKTNHQYKLEEDQSSSDLLVAMRGVYMEQGEYKPTNIVHQVKVLNKKLVDYVVPDMISGIKQHYAYQKDINEPLKPIDRPMNVCNAGRRTLPSITTVWTRT